MTQWIAVGIFGAIIGTCFILLFAIGWIEVELNSASEISADCGCGQKELVRYRGVPGLQLNIETR